MGFLAFGPIFYPFVPLLACWPGSWVPQSNSWALKTRRPINTTNPAELVMQRAAWSIRLWNFSLIQSSPPEIESFQVKSSRMRPCNSTPNHGFLTAVPDWLAAKCRATQKSLSSSIALGFPHANKYARVQVAARTSHTLPLPNLQWLDFSLWRLCW